MRVANAGRERQERTHDAEGVASNIALQEILSSQCSANFATS